MLILGGIAFLIVTIGVMILCIPFVIRKLSNVDKFFTSLYSNGIKFADRGGVFDKKTRVWQGSFDHMIPDVPGYIIDDPWDPNAEFREALPGEKQPMSLLNRFLGRKLGVYYYGFYPFKHIRTFDIERVRENIQGTKPDNWLIREENKVDSVIRFNFPRPYIFTNVELADGQSIHMKLVTKIQIVKPYIPAYQFPSDFFTQTGSIIQSEVIDELVQDTNLSLPVFRNKPKGEVDGLLKEFKEPRAGNLPSVLNQVLINQTGQQVVGIGINDWTPANEAIRTAMEQEALENAQGLARVAKANQDFKVTKRNAEAYRERVSIETNADVARQNAIAVSHANFISGTRDALLLPGSDPTAVSIAAGKVAEMEAVASSTSKINTLVTGNAGLTVPAGGTK